MTTPVLVLGDCEIASTDIARTVAFHPLGSANVAATFETTATADCNIQIDTHGAAQLRLVDTVGSFDMTGIVNFGQPRVKANELGTNAELPGMITRRAQTSNNSASGAVVSEAPTLTGVSGAGGHSTIVLAVGSSAVDGAYVDWFIRITSGPAIDNVRQIVAYTGASRLATVDSAFTADTFTSESYSLYSRVYTGMLFDESSDTIRADIGATGGHEYLPVHASAFVAKTALSPARVIAVDFTSGASVELVANDPLVGTETIAVEKIVQNDVANTFSATQSIAAAAPQLTLATASSVIRYEFAAALPAASRTINIEDFGGTGSMVLAESEPFVCDYMDDTSTIPLIVDYSHTLTRHGAKVTISWPTIFVTASGGGTIALKSELAIPAKYRPANDLTFVAVVLSTGVRSYGHVVIASTGTIYWYSSVDRLAWAGTANDGFYATAVTY